MARGPWASTKHDLLARHEHWPNMIFLGSGRHEHGVGLVLGCDLSPSRWSSSARKQPARHSPLAGTTAHGLTGPPSMVPYISQHPTPNPSLYPVLRLCRLLQHVGFHLLCLVSLLHMSPSPDLCRPATLSAPPLLRRRWLPSSATTLGYPPSATSSAWGDPPPATSSAWGICRRRPPPSHPVAHGMS